MVEKRRRIEKGERTRSRDEAPRRTRLRAMLEVRREDGLRVRRVIAHAIVYEHQPNPIISHLLGGWLGVTKEDEDNTYPTDNAARSTVPNSTQTCPRSPPRAGPAR